MSDAPKAVSTAEWAVALLAAGADEMEFSFPILSDIWPAKVFVSGKQATVEWEFHGPSDFPYDPVFVDTADGWLKKSPMPSVVLCVSQVTGFGMWLPVRSSSAGWVVRQTRDRVRDIIDTFYAAPLACWGRVLKVQTRIGVTK